MAAIVIFLIISPHPSASLTPVSPPGSVVAKQAPLEPSNPQGGEGLICFLADYVAWALFGFHVGFADVFSDDAKGDELDAAKEANSYHNASPAAKGISKEVLDNRINQKYQADECYKNTEACDHTDRLDAK